LKVERGARVDCVIQMAEIYGLHVTCVNMGD
jgi:hypothetical protein